MVHASEVLVAVGEDDEILVEDGGESIGFVLDNFVDVLDEIEVELEVIFLVELLAN